MPMSFRVVLAFSTAICGALGAMIIAGVYLMVTNPQALDFWDYLTGALLSTVWLYSVVSIVRDYRELLKRRWCCAEDRR